MYVRLQSQTRNCIMSSSKKHDSSSDILQPLPLSKYNDILEILREEWPLFAYIYYRVENTRKWKMEEPSLKLDIYSPEGDPKTGVFVIISAFSLLEITLFSTKNSEHILREAIKTTKCIEWNKKPWFFGIYERMLPILFSVLEELEKTHDIQITDKVAGNFYLKSAEECAAHEINVPGGCYLGRIRDSDVPIIHSVWPQRDPENPEHFNNFLTTMVRLNKSIGLYSKENDALLSWVIQNNWGGLGMAQTLEEHRRKGYAQVVVKALSKEIGLEGKSVSLFVIRGNVPSETMFMNNLKWNCIAPVTWVHVRQRPLEII